MRDFQMPLSLVACRTAQGKYAQKLLTDLFANYTSALRPVEDTHNILNVTLQVTLSQIIDMVKQSKVCAFTHTAVFINITSKSIKKQRSFSSVVLVLSQHRSKHICSRQIQHLITVQCF